MERKETRTGNSERERDEEERRGRRREEEKRKEGVGREKRGMRGREARQLRETSFMRSF